MYVTEFEIVETEDSAIDSCCTLTMLEANQPNETAIASVTSKAAFSFDGFETNDPLVAKLDICMVRRKIPLKYIRGVITNIRIIKTNLLTNPYVKYEFDKRKEPLEEFQGKTQTRFRPNPIPSRGDRLLVDNNQFRNRQID